MKRKTARKRKSVRAKRTVRTKAKKITKRKIKTSRPAARRSKKKKQKLSPRIAAKKTMPEQLHTEQSKSFVRPHAVTAALIQNLPQEYGTDMLLAYVRDPYWIYTHWEITAHAKAQLQKKYGAHCYHSGWVLRVYDVSYIEFNGQNAHRHFDIQTTSTACQWYIPVVSGHSFIIDLGIKLPDGTFITVVRSNCVTTPLDEPSSVIDEEWLIPDALFQSLYGESIGFGSSPTKGAARRKKQHVSSGGWASMRRPVHV